MDNHGLPDHNVQSAPPQSMAPHLRSSLPPEPEEEEGGGLNIKMILWVGFGVAALGLIAFYAISKNWKKKGGFEDEWDNYIALYDEKKPPPRKLARFPQEKLVLIDISAGLDEATVAPLFYDLSENVRATSSDEVGCVGYLKWGTVEVGRYSDGFAGYTATCDLRIVNLDTKEIVIYKTFRGPPPPDRKENWGPELAKKPIEEVTMFLDEQVEWKNAEEIAVITKQQNDASAALTAEEERVRKIEDDRIAADKAGYEERMAKLNNAIEKSKREKAEAEAARLAKEGDASEPEVEEPSEADLLRKAEEEKARLAQEEREATMAEARAERREKNAARKKVTDARFDEFKADELVPNLDSLEFAKVTQAAKTLGADEDFPELEKRMDEAIQRFTSYKQLHDASAEILEKSSYTGSLKHKAGNIISNKRFTTTDGKLQIVIAQGRSQMKWSQLHPESYITLLEFCARKMGTEKKAAAEKIIHTLKLEFAAAGLAEPEH